MATLPYQGAQITRACLSGTGHNSLAPPYDSGASIQRILSAGGPAMCVTRPTSASVACLCATTLLLCACGGDASEGRSARGDAPEPVVFYSHRYGDAEIFVLRADGTAPMRLTYHSAADVNPDISPDGRSVIFTSNRAGNDDIWIVGIDGGEPRSLANLPSNERWPRWSPDGRRIAYHGNRDGNPEIYVMNADGSDLTRLTNYPGPDGWPEWSPAGDRLAFRQDHDVWVMDADGANPVRLTDHPALDQMAAWSPDGTRIAFMSMRDGYCSVFLMNADGSDQRNLTPKDPGDADDAWCSRAPAWSRDGRIYFMSMRPSTGGDTELFVMNADGSAVSRLTSSPGLDGAPRAPRALRAPDIAGVPARAAVP